MQIEQIQQLTQQAFPNGEVQVNGDGSHFEVQVVSEEFEGKSLLQKQKMVNAPLAELLTSGAIHALSIKAYTPVEWQKASALLVK